MPTTQRPLGATDALILQTHQQLDQQRVGSLFCRTRAGVSVELCLTAARWMQAAACGLIKRRLLDRSLGVSSLTMGTPKLVLCGLL
jgi:hypothetical protein